MKEKCTSERLLVLQYKLCGPTSEWHDLRTFRSYESLDKAKYSFVIVIPEHFQADLLSALMYLKN